MLVWVINACHLAFSPPPPKYFSSFSPISRLQFMWDTFSKLDTWGRWNSELQFPTYSHQCRSLPLRFPSSSFFNSVSPASLGVVVRRCSDILSCYPEPEMKVLRASYPFKTPPLTPQALSHWSEKLLVAWYPSTCLHISASVCRSCRCVWDFFSFSFWFISVVMAGL